MSQLPQLLKGARIPDAVVLPFLNVLQAFFLAIGVFATREAFGALHSGGPLASWTLTKLIGAGLCVSGLEILSRTCAERIGQSYANSLRIVLYHHLAGMQKSELEERRLGALSLRFVGDLSAARNWFGRGLPRVIAAAIILPGTGLVLWLLDPRIAIASGAVLLVTILLMVLAAIGFEVLHQKLRNRRANISIAMMERIAIAPQLDLMGRTTRELDALDVQGQQLRSNATARAWRAGLLGTIPQAGLVLAGGVALWQAASLGIATGTVAATLSLLAILTLPLRDLANAWDYYCAWRIARVKALSLLAKTSHPRKIIERNKPIAVEVLGQFSNRPVALKITAGAIGELRGGNICDRSALAMVLAGLDAAPDLQVCYGSQSLDLPRISFVGEIPVTLQGSLRRALTLGIDPRPKRKTTMRMAERFGLQTLLSRDPNSLMTRIAEGARNVTTAEGLRIDLARVALTKPDLVVIDTSRLAGDPEKDALIRRLRHEINSTIVIVNRVEIAGSNLRFDNLEMLGKPRSSAKS